MRLTSALACLFLVPVLALVGCGRKPPLSDRRLDELETMLQNADGNTQAEAAHGLGEKGAAAIPALTAALGSTDPLVRQQACLGLGKIGPDAVAAAPELLRCLEDAEWAVRRQAALALGQIKPPRQQVEPSLRQCEQDPRPLVRKAAREALAALPD